MLILCTVRPIGSRDEREFRTFNYDWDIPQERQAAGKEIHEALSRNYSVLSRRISARLPHHQTIMQLVAQKQTAAAE